ncbi:DUF1997 domain-containing protein [Candidatus Chlorohelix sp.]|uniref:DUF1997 domain-containing protein n=1 Tax=Candidatus Chlorohelix sp. TaxID=3139201 RepID=UPI003061E489
MTFIMGVDGVFSKIFKIEAPIEVVYAFLCDFDYTLPRMPQVEQVLQLSEDKYRMFYSADVVAGYKMHVLFDIRPEKLDGNVLKFLPVSVSSEEMKKIRSTHSESLFTGKFTGYAKFVQNGKRCDIHYKAQIRLEVEVPQFLRYLPTNALSKLGSKVMSYKMNSVGDEMALALPREFPKWRMQNQSKLDGIIKAGL